ncbi:hypothetical protein LEP1GSC195_1534 [Leptospira wolbachii serovar Codice str. CDC]|uniref:Uncharacterized protein n=1 Tax=Leptospira wolbachii serovar Codice str. CDC TaxID=1218599 RepID=R9A252_9LEPT|nr:hypothetical protein [Leptospira wolbachii]EOQ96094.1 hypothetical protein LEP1GSC195_1534 [Leptospira wolbachii serovar Codice str. CDC]
MKRIYLLLFFLLSVFSLGSKPIEDKDIYSSIVNWTDLLISSSVKETIPKIVFDEEDPEFSGKNTATQARAKPILWLGRKPVKNSECA